MKLAIFYPFSNYEDGELSTGYAETMWKFETCSEHGSVHTSQMCFLTQAWESDYVVFIVNSIGIPIRIQNGMKGVDKELRKEHNMFRLWQGGALGNLLLPTVRENED